MTSPLARWIWSSRADRVALLQKAEDEFDAGSDTNTEIGSDETRLPDARLINTGNTCASMMAGRGGSFSHDRKNAKAMTLLVIFR